MSGEIAVGGHIDGGVLGAGVGDAVARPSCEYVAWLGIGGDINDRAAVERIIALEGGRAAGRRGAGHV